MNPLRRGFIYLCSADSKRLAACVSAKTASLSLSLMLPPPGHLVRHDSRVGPHSVAVCCTKV